MFLNIFLKIMQLINKLGDSGGGQFFQCSYYYQQLFKETMQTYGEKGCAFRLRDIHYFVCV